MKSLWCTIFLDTPLVEYWIVLPNTVGWHFYHKATSVFTGASTNSESRDISRYFYLKLHQFSGEASTNIIYIMILSDMENLLSVGENVLSMAKVTKYGQYFIKERESATHSVAPSGGQI